MRLSIVGSRGFTDFNMMKQEIIKHYNIDDIECVISGGAVGADTLAEYFAKEYNIPMKIYPAEWKKYGKSAGYIRNELIIKDSTDVISFWDGKSTGTKHSMDLACTHNKKLVTVYFNPTSVI
jgi:hypothetical protein